MTPLTWNSDRRLEPGGVAATARVGTKWRNFLSADGWRPIKIAPREAGGLFTVAEAPYRAEFPLLANGDSRIDSTNIWDLWTKQRRDEAPVGITKRYPTATPVAGVAIADGVRYPLAFPALNANRLVQFRTQEVRDLVEFTSEPPGDGPVELPLVIDFGTLPILKSVGLGKTAVEADLKNEVAVSQGLSFTTSSFRGVKIKAPRVWDASGRRAAIGLLGRVVGNRFIGKKVIPRAFFSKAKYPVYADTTSTFFPDPDPETTTFDGWCIAGDGSTEYTWADVHDASDVGPTGGFSTDDATNGVVGVWAGVNTNTWFNIARVFKLFDSSAIPDTGAISSASLNLKHIGPAIDDYTDTLEVVASTPASNTGIADADFDQVGATSFGNIALSSLSSGTYFSIPFNASGKAAINKAGVSKFAVLMGKDFNNNSTWSGASTASTADFDDADTPGTGSDPYLEVTYSVPSAARRLLLLGVGR